MILGLLLTVVTALPIIAYFGVTPVLQQIVDSSTTTAMNATVWSAYSSFGIETILPIFIISICLLVICFIIFGRRAAGSYG